MPKSIRWQLPLSYGAIALFTTVALGLILLVALRGYYHQQERAYLKSNAQAISATLAPLLEADPPVEALKSQLSSFAFLSQTQVRLLNRDQEVLVDTGIPQNQQELLALSMDIEVEVEADEARQTVTQTMRVGEQESQYTPFIVIRKTALENLNPVDTLPGTQVEIDLARQAPDELDQGLVVKEAIAIKTNDITELEEIIRQEIELGELPGLISSISAGGTPYGFGFDANRAGSSRRSDQRISYPVYNARGLLLGTIELSNGPAYGDQVLRSVAWGWGMAGGLAIVLAAAVGWRISRRINRPLLQLIEATSRMAEGNLTMRAEETTNPDEFRTLATSFNQMARQMEETIVALRHFVADAAHELHTPLTALRTNLELASEENQGHCSNFVERAHSQAQRLERLTNNLLTLSRLETEMTQVKFTTVDLTRLLQESSEYYASQADQAGIVCTFDLPNEAVTIRGNEDQLRQVVDNLMENAIKFTPEGGSVRVRLRRSVDRQSAELSIKNNGIGIPLEDQPHLFNRFHRGRNATPYPGSGLGLAIVNAIVDKHGGQIEVKNLERGVSVTVTLAIYLLISD